MWARFTVLNETPIASAIAGCVIPLSRSNTIWMRSRCAAGIFHRSAVFSSRICFLVHLTIRPPESDSQSESYPAPSRDPEKRQKSLDSNSYGSGIKEHDTGEGSERIDCLAEGEPGQCITRDRRCRESAAHRRRLFPEGNGHSLSIRALSRRCSGNARFGGRADRLHDRSGDEFPPAGA